MSDASPFGFGKFIPGFDFLQGLAQSTGSATARPLGRLPEWVAPTVSIEEVDKRITELKAVQFWLEQNGKALAATIQALEVQRMTLSTLKGMNVSMGELAQAFQFPTGMAAGAAAGTAKEGSSDHSDWPMSSAGRQAPKKEQPASSAPAEAAPPSPEPRPESAGADASPSQETPAQAAAVGQAMQWWGALTQQFQQIAAKAMAEPMAPEAVAAAQRATGMAGDFAKAAMERMAAQTSAFAAQAATAPAAAPQPAAARKAADARPAAPAARKKPAARAAAPAKDPAKAPASAGKAVRKPAAKGRTVR